MPIKSLELRVDMNRILLIMTMVLIGATEGAKAQSVAPQAHYTDKEGMAIETTSIEDGEAPLAVHFEANPQDMGTWTPSFEWHFRHKAINDKSKNYTEKFVRYEENTDYTFMESGSYEVVLKTIISDGTNTDQLDSMTISVVIAESKLEFPNAFSPNGDGINDIYRAKRDYKSIVSFKAIVMNRWGQKLYEWTNPEDGWDGTFHGQDVKQGVYFVFVEAKGADGKEYKIKKDINLLRGYTEKSNTTN